MMIEFHCQMCLTNNTKDAKYYDGLLGYEAIVCKKCGAYYDHIGGHLPDDWSKNFVGLKPNPTPKEGIDNSQVKS